KLERLPLVTRGQLSLVSLTVFWKTLAQQRLTRVAFHLTKRFLQPFRKIAARFHHHCAAAIFHHVGGKTARCRERAGFCWQNHARYSERTRKLYGVKAASAAERNQCELARVVTAFDGDCAKRTLHVYAYNFQNA